MKMTMTPPRFPDKNVRLVSSATHSSWDDYFLCPYPKYYPASEETPVEG
jgi:hypothetical protein